jgi:hypothetical protein
MSVMPVRLCSARICSSRSFAIRRNSAIIDSIWFSCRRFSSTWNRLNRIRLLRAFIETRLL